MPAVPDSTDVSIIIKNDVDNYVKHAACYKRQYDLINEVLLRENTK